MQTDAYIIHLERSGGFAGISRTLELKSDTLNVDDRKLLDKLIENSEFFELQTKTAPGKPDGFVYTLTVKTRGKEKTFETGDSNMPDKLWPLIDFLEGKMRSR